MIFTERTLTSLTILILYLHPTYLYIYIALVILTVFKQANRTKTYTTYNTSNIIFFYNLCFFLLTNRFLYLHNCTYIIYLKMLALLFFFSFFFSFFC